jgi:hypothetical protein
LTPSTVFTTIRRVSQYPSPYPQPPYMPAPLDYSQYASAGYGEALKPARRASVLQGILGALTLGCGVLIGAMPFITDVEELILQSGNKMPELPPGYSMDEMLRIVFGMLGGCSGVLGLAMLVLCFFVRSGSRGAIFTSMALTGVILAVLALRVVVGLVQVLSNPLAIVDLIMGVALAGVFGLNMFWLSAAAKSGPAAMAAQHQYMAQYYHYQQQQYAYNQAAAAQGAPYAPPGYVHPPQQQQPPPPLPPPSNPEA